MRILGIDPGRYTGYAYGSIKDHAHDSGVWDLGPHADLRTGRLVRDLKAIIAKYRPEVVAVEIASMGGKFRRAQARLDELAGTIEGTAQDCGCEVWKFNISTWKARAIGNGRAKKPQIIQRLKLFYGAEVRDENEADATAILFAAQQGPPPEPVKKQTRRIERAIAKRQGTLFGTGRR